MSVLLLSACPRGPEEPAVRILELEPLYFTATRTGDTVEVKSYEASELFAEAERLYREGQYSAARAKFVALAADAVEPEAAGRAWFNAALCDLALQKPGPALDALDRADKALPAAHGDVLLLRVQALAMSGDWQRVLALGDELLAPGTLPPLRGARLHQYVGQAHFLEGRLAEAEGHFRVSIDLVLAATLPKDQKGNSLLASGYFRLAQVYRSLFVRIRLRLPVERMAIDLTDKLTLMRRAEDQYLAAVRVRDAEWSPRSGFEMGKRYEAFGRDLLEAEVPADLTEEELRIYTEELNAKVVPLLRRAVEIHRKNVNMCAKNQFGAQWKEQSAIQIETLQKMISGLEHKPE